MFRSLSCAALLLAAVPSFALSKVLIGAECAAGEPKLDLKALGAKKPKPLFVVIDTPYEIWSGMGSYVHVVAYRADFQPAAGAKVYAGGRCAGVADEHGTLVFRNVPRGGEGEGQGQNVRAVL